MRYFRTYRIKLGDHTCCDHCTDAGSCCLCVRTLVTLRRCKAPNMKKSLVSGGQKNPERMIPTASTGRGP